jgi:CRISPR system Cascade subunit CasA
VEGVDERFAFNLVDEPWLPVRLLDGTRCELGLVDTLTRAHELAGLDIEFPTQEPALLRLLLAVCYRALNGPADDAAWNALWHAESLPEATFTAYLGQWRTRFDLFSPDAPFFQTPGLEPAGKGGIKPANKLVAHAPAGNNVPIFTPITDASAQPLQPAEAARWVIERHAWGTAADKTGAAGNSRVKAGKDTPPLGYLGWIGFVAPIGRTLRETLLLNLVPASRTGLVATGPGDLPAWERPPTGPERVERPPRGVCDLFTWQGRRIRLFPERRDGQVLVPRVLVCAGDDVQRDAVRTIDPHTGWRVSKQRDGTLTYLPAKPRVGQQVWRGLSALLALEEGNQRAGVLSWVAALEERGVSVVSLLVTAAEFGSMSTTLDDLLADRLDAAVAILRTGDLEAATLAGDAAAFAERAARALWHVANGPFLSYDAERQRYAVPEGKDDGARGARQAIAEELFSELDAPFRRFLVDLATPRFVETGRRSWADHVTTVARALAARHLAQLSAANAFTGAAADRMFRRALRAARSTFDPVAETKGAVA